MSTVGITANAADLHYQLLILLLQLSTVIYNLHTQQLPICEASRMLKGKPEMF